MADEVRVYAGLTIQKRDSTTGLLLQDYQSRPTAFTTDMDGIKGPTPGALTIPTGGKVVSLAELQTPGWCWIWNLDSSNYVEWGIYDVSQNQFTAIGEIGPGEGIVFKFSRNFTEEYDTTGTGTSSLNAAQFFMKANSADVQVRVEAFEA